VPTLFLSLKLNKIKVKALDSQNQPKLKLWTPALDFKN
jgi:hypothetical protein